MIINSCDISTIHLGNIRNVSSIKCGEIHSSVTNTNTVFRRVILIKTEQIKRIKLTLFSNNRENLIVYRNED
jgi:hypothetical protein